MTIQSYFLDARKPPFSLLMELYILRNSNVIRSQIYLMQSLFCTCHLAAQQNLADLRNQSADAI